MKMVKLEVPDSLSDRDVKLVTVVEAFSRGLVSVGRAAEMAQVSLPEFLVELRKRHIPAYPYTDQEALQELKF